MADQTTSGRRTSGSNDRRRESWRDHALCEGMDTDLFFPISSTGPVLPDIAEAKRVCGLCPVRTPCLEWAIDHGVDHGIWGGCTEVERRDLALHRRARLTRSGLRRVN